MLGGCPPLDLGASGAGSVYAGRADTLRLELLGLALLSHDQRAVLASQLNDEPPAAACVSLGWSAQKYRKGAQRARSKLRDRAACSPR